MSVITGAQLAAGRFISDTPADGALAGQKPDGTKRAGGEKPRRVV